MKREKWDIVPKTLEKIRKWAWCKNPEDLAHRIVYGFRNSYGENSSGKKLGRPFSDEEHRKNSQRDKEKNYTDWVKWIKDFEQEKDRPAFWQLQKISTACHRHHLFFTMEEERVILPETPEDFRKDPKEQIANQAECHPFIRNTLAKFDWVRSTFRKDNPGHRASFLDDFTKEDKNDNASLVKEASRLVSKMEEHLYLDLDVWRKKSKSKQLEELKNSIDRKNIIVVSATRSDEISDQVLKGFALYDDVLPLIALNNGEYGKDENFRNRGVNIFTLIHELAHLYTFKNKRVVSGGYSLEDDCKQEVRDRERFCNMVAEEFILPKRDFEKIIPIDLPTSSDGLGEKLKDLAREKKISKWVLLYRSLHLGKLNKGGELSSAGEIDRRAYKIFSDVRNEYFKETREYLARRDENRKAAAKKYKEKIEQQEDESQEEEDFSPENSHRVAKRVMEVNSKLFCQVALGSYLTSELDHKTMTDLLGVKRLGALRQLRELTHD